MEDIEVTQTVNHNADEAVLLTDPKDKLITQLQDQLKEQKDQYMRIIAETENSRKRSLEESAKAKKYAVESFAENLLNVADSLRAALSGISDTIDRIGVEMTLTQLTQAFEKAKIRSIAPQEHDQFDPKLHQAVSTQESDKDNTIVSVLQNGYQLDDRILRPAMVVVSKLKQEDATYGQDIDDYKDGQDQTGTTESGTVE